MVLLSACTQTPATTETPSFIKTTESEPAETAAPSRTPRPTPTPTESPAIAIEPEDLSGIALRFMHPWTGETADALAEIATQFSLTNPWDIWVDAEGYGGESALLEAILTEAAAGHSPGLVALHPYLLAALDGDYTPVPLTEYYNDPAWGFDEDAQSDVHPVLLSQFTLEGELMALPIAPQATVLFYNKTWAESLGFSSQPEDERDFQQQTCGAAFANRDSGNPEKAGTGGWVVNLGPNVLSAWFHSFGGDLPETGNPEFNTEAGQDAFGFLKAGNDQGCFWTGRKSDPYSYFANRFALSYAGKLNEIPVQAGWMTALESEDQWTVMGFPGTEGQVIVIDGPGLMIRQDTPENQLAAWLFARHLLSIESQVRLVPTLFSLPVRQSAVPLLDGFVENYPQWGAGVSLLDNAVSLPVSTEWGVSQWLLQDAVFRLLQSPELSAGEILEELDQMIIEMEGTSP